jgi:hypothetical protein
MDNNGRQLVFAVKKGTDSTLLWKGTVRIACVKVDLVTKKIDTYRLLTLNEFLRVSYILIQIYICEPHIVLILRFPVVRSLYLKEGALTI